MKTLLLNEEVNCEADCWNESDFKASGSVVGSNTAGVVLQALEDNKLPVSEIAAYAEGAADYLSEDAGFSFSAQEGASNGIEIIDVTKADNGTKIYGGEGLDLYLVNGADEVEIINGQAAGYGEGITPAQGLGIIKVGAGSARITYNGGKGQDLITLQKDSGDACVVNAGEGNDIITVQAGKDHVLTGGVGNDKYVIDALVAGGTYTIIQTGAGSKDRDTLDMTAFKSTEFKVEASNGQDVVLVHANKARLIIKDWYNSPLMNIAFGDTRVRVSELAQSNGYTSYNLKLAGEYTFSGNNKVVAESATLKNNTSMDKLTVSGSNNTVVVNGGLVTVNSGSHNVIDNSVNKGEVKINGGDHLTVQGSAGVDYLKIYGGSDIVADLGDGQDQVEIYGGADNTLNFGSGQDRKSVVFNASAGDNYTIMAEATENEIEIKGGSGHTITCGAYADKITINNAKGQDYIINTGDGDDYVLVKAGHVKVLEMGVGNQTLILENGAVDSFKSMGDVTTVIRGGVVYINENTKKLPVLEYGDNTVYFDNVNLQEFKGGTGKDTFILNSGYIGTLMGDAGDDTFIINSGSVDSMLGGLGNDTFTLSGNVGNVQGDDGDDSFTLNSGSVDSMLGGPGNDTFTMSGNVGAVQGDDGNDSFTLNSGSVDSMLGGPGNDTFAINSGYVSTMMGGKGSDTYVLNHMDNNQQYVIDQTLPNGMKPLNSEKDSLVLSNYDSSAFSIAKDESGNILLTNNDLNTVVRIEGWTDNALDSIVFKDKTVSGRTIEAATGMGGEGLSQLQIIRDFMNVLDTTTAYGNAAFDAAVLGCSRGLYSSAQDLIDHFINDCTTHGGNTYATQKQFLLEYCGINLDNTDTGAITGADAGGPVVKTAVSVVEEPKDMTLDDLVYNYTDTIQAYDYFGYGTKTYTCAKVNCNGESITFYWDEAKVQSLVDRGLISNREQLDKIIAGVIEAWGEASFNLISESFGMSLTEEDSYLYKAADGSRAIMLALDYASPSVKSMYISGLSSSWLAAVSSTSSPSLVLNGQYSSGVKEAMLINTYYYQGGFRDINGRPATTSLGSQYLDRVISHELTHGTMAANINGFSSLPSFLKEGMAELVHGVDDTRYSEILSMANTGWSTYYVSDGHTENQRDLLEKVFDLKASTNSMSTYTYGGGYALLRYLAKTSSEYTKNLSWSDFDYDGYAEALRNLEMTFEADSVGIGQEIRDIYVDPYYAELCKVAGNC